MSDESGIEVRHGSANVFADLEFPDAEAHRLKAELVRRIGARIGERQLTQARAAELLGIGQPDVSRMLRGRFRDFSVERLMRFLTLLGCEVDIVIRPNGETARAETIHLQPAAA